MICIYIVGDQIFNSKTFNIAGFSITDAFAKDADLRLMIISLRNNKHMQGSFPQISRYNVKLYLFLLPISAKR